jgi:catechol 2,3-dioxygenase-like lactoylglutathione lyase family enzyme
VITGINHLTLSVREVEESFAFYTQMLGFRPLAKWPRGVYLLAGDVWLALILDEQVRPAAFPEYTHIAFTVSPHDFTALSERIVAAGMSL